MASLVAPVVRLFTNDITPGPDTDLLALSEPAGTWYAEQALTYGQAYQNPDGSITVTAESVQFNYTGASSPETVRGWFVVDPGSPDVPISARRLPTPVSMGNALDSVIVQPGFTVPPIAASA